MLHVFVTQLHTWRCGNTIGVDLRREIYDQILKWPRHNPYGTFFEDNIYAESHTSW